MIENRRSARVTTNQAVTVTTVLSCEEATIVDLSETGAQIRGASHPRNTRICIDAGDDLHPVSGPPCWQLSSVLRSGRAMCR